MNVDELALVEMNQLNVVSLFNHALEESSETDPLTDLILEGKIEDEMVMSAPKREATLVDENQFPDQAMFVLEKQLSNLKSSLNRIKFYMGEIDELVR